MGLTKPRAAQILDLDYKQAVRAVSVSSITLSGSAPASLDGISLAVNDRILVTAQSTGSQNGIYYVATVGSGSNGSWTRSSDADTTGEIDAGLIIMVTEGSVYQDTQWKLTTNNPIVVGTTSLTFTLMSTSATGDVVGPSTATDNAIVRFDSTTGKLVQNSVVTISDTGDTAGVGALTVVGAATLSSATLSSTLGVTGAATLSSTLGVTGAATLSSTLGVTGNITGGNVTTAGITNTGTATVTGAATVGSTLGVTGATTLSSTLGVSGASTLAALSATTGSFSSTLGVTGALTVGGDSSFTSTGALQLPASTTANRPGASTGKIRYNTTTGTFEGYGASSWGSIGGGATGAGGDTVFQENQLTVTTSYTLSTGKSAMSVGPITINSGAAVTIPSGYRWMVL